MNTVDINAQLSKNDEANTATLGWTVQNEPSKYVLSVQVDEIDVSAGKGARIVDDQTVCAGSVRMLKRQIEIELQPGKSYDCRLVVRTLGDGGQEEKGSTLPLDSWHQCVAHKSDEHEYLSDTQMDNLLASAKQFCSKSEWKPIDYFSRSQFDEEWAEMEQQNGVISTRVRVFNHGHHSGQISRLSYSFGGVYFFARPDKHSACSRIDKSPFGDRLKEFPADILFGADNLALFFADIKCYGKEFPGNDEHWAHYITIAVCLRGSGEEEFCNKNLVPLDLYQNDFLRFSPESGQVLVPVREIEGSLGPRNPIWIEIFLMRDVKIANLGQLRSREVELMGKWNNRPADQPLSPVCELCRADGLTSADAGDVAASTESPSSIETKMEEMAVGDE